jgi:hypothetical protein
MPVNTKSKFHLLLSNKGVVKPHIFHRDADEEYVRAVQYYTVIFPDKPDCI